MTGAAERWRGLALAVAAALALAGCGGRADGYRPPMEPQFGTCSCHPAGDHPIPEPPPRVQ